MAKKSTHRTKALEQRRRDQGLCVECGHKPEPDYVWCQACRDRNNRWRNSHPRALKAGEKAEQKRERTRNAYRRKVGIDEAAPLYPGSLYPRKQP